jgi:hypothetical protein
MEQQLIMYDLKFFTAVTMKNGVFWEEEFFVACVGC